LNLLTKPVREIDLSGEFTVINPYLVQDLKKIGLWDAAMVYDLKYYNGSLAANRTHSSAV